VHRENVDEQNTSNCSGNDSLGNHFDGWRGVQSADTSSEIDTPSATSATAPVPLYALSRLEAETLAEQEMTDQELKAVEGGASMVEYIM
jgi:bacteriocin-like protein